MAQSSGQEWKRDWRDYKCETSDLPPKNCSSTADCPKQSCSNKQIDFRHPSDGKPHEGAMNHGGPVQSLLNTLPATSATDILRSEETRLNSSHIQKSRMPSSA